MNNPLITGEEVLDRLYSHLKNEVKFSPTTLLGDKWQAAAIITPVFGPFGVNLEAGVARKMGLCSLFAQFNYGYGEALTDWVRGYRPAPYLRIGVLFGDLLAL